MDRSICEGSPADLTQLVDTLSSAFQHDPALSWILPDPDQAIRHFFGRALREAREAQPS